MEQTGVVVRFDLADVPLDEVSDDDLSDWMGQNLELALWRVNDVLEALPRIHKSIALTGCLHHLIDCEDEISSNLVEIKKLIETAQHQLIPADDAESELL